MKRRDFIKLSAGLGATMAATAPLSSAFAQTKMVLKASDVHPLGYPTVEAVVRMGKKLEAATNGRLTIQMFPSMQLGGEKEMIDQVFSSMQTGVVDGAENNPPSFMAQNHYQVAKYFTMTEHLIIPELLVFSRISWQKLSPEDQALIKKLSKETQAEQRVLWYEAENAAIAKMKAAGTEIITDIDKKPFQDAVKPVWDKYGAKYAAMVKRIEAVN